MEVTTYHIKNIPYMHDRHGMIPEEQKELYSDPRRHLSTNARETEKVTSGILNTYFVTTQSWFTKFSNTNANVHYEPLQTWRR